MRLSNQREAFLIAPATTATILILKMYIPGQICIFNALNSDGYSTGNAPPSGNNNQYSINSMNTRLLQNSAVIGGDENLL